MPITVFNIKGLPATRREAIEAAVEAAGLRLSAPYEAWITAPPLSGCIKVLSVIEKRSFLSVSPGDIICAEGASHPSGHRRFGVW